MILEHNALWVFEWTEHSDMKLEKDKHNLLVYERKHCIELHWQSDGNLFRLQIPVTTGGLNCETLTHKVVT